MTRQISAGGIKIGGGAPVTVQSMTNTRTSDAQATVAQIGRLQAAGCDIVRVAVPDMASAKAIGIVKERVSLPVVADIHFDYRLAVEAAAAGADKIRLNPGNIGGDEAVKAVVSACRRRGIPIRIGVNGGSLEKRLLEKYGKPTPEAMVESAMGHIELLRRYDFDDICVSLKASDVRLTMDAYRLMRERADYPLHLGVTEAGTQYMGVVKSAVGIGGLLSEGIGDTIRVSLTAAPEEEVKAGIGILKALGLRKAGVKFISCPSCGRCGIDLIKIAGEVEKRLEGRDCDITVAVMGCEVNGPGEARHADFGIAGGKAQGALFMKGEVVGRVPQDELPDALIELIDEHMGEIRAKERLDYG